MTPLLSFSFRSEKKSPIFLLALVLTLGSPVLAAGSAPPIGENAYCGKGDVPQFGPKDGVAELPKTCYYTALDGTPSLGKQIRVSAKADLAGALETAKCGDILLLPAGASFDVTLLPFKRCDERHYITVRTDTPDSKLPPEGTRISPAWAGVASLPGRPAFLHPAGGPAKLMATIVVIRPSGAVVGDHIRFIGIEWTSRAEPRVSRLVTTEHGDHIIFDRNYFHPAEGAEVAHGVGMVDGTRFVAVINSYISGLNCMARAGRCTDATAVGGGHSDDPIGTFKIYNNFLESSGENILFGGAPSNMNPTDIEIRRNHLFRPAIWREGDPGYTPSPAGTPYIVKNNFELKSAVRVLFEANLLENSWGGFSQTGFSILLTPRSQASQCPICRVNDVTVRFNRIRNVASVFQISNWPAGKGGGAPADGGRYSIHDIIADDVHDRDYKGGGGFLLLVSQQPPVHDVQIDHVTAFVPGGILAILNTQDKLANFSLTNSVFSVGDRRPPVHSGGGGPTNCATKTQMQGAEAVLKECFSSFKFDKNLIITGHGPWPAGTLAVSSPQDAGIRDLKDGIARDPRLCREKGAGCTKKSPGAAADGGRDLGADVGAVEAAIAGVE